MHALDESDLLLDLLREAGDEPVTLDELQIVGVRRPAEALLALELAGHTVHRVFDNRVACVRLGSARPAPALAPPPAPGTAARAAGPGLRLVLAAVLGVLVLVLLTRRD